MLIQIIYFFYLGLTLEVFLDQSNYMKNRLSKKAGGKIVIHDPNTPPLPNEYGLELRPNTASSIAVQVIIYQSQFIFSSIKVFQKVNIKFLLRFTPT